MARPPRAAPRPLRGVNHSPKWGSYQTNKLVIPGRCEASNPESRDSGSGPSDHPGMTGPVIHDDGFNPDRASRDHAMRFDLVDLQLFVSVADARSITGGADRVHLALASVSERIKGLEDALGVALLTRGRRGVALTAAGESLLDHARLILHNVDAMRGDLARFASGVRASVHLLANTVGLSEHLPKALAAFLRDNPDISVDVEERESTDIAAAIASGAADLGFAAEHALPDIIERFVFGEDRLALVAPRRGPFAGRRQIAFQEVAGHDFIGLTQATALQLHIAR